MTAQLQPTVIEESMVLKELQEARGFSQGKEEQPLWGWMMTGDRQELRRKKLSVGVTGSSLLSMSLEGREWRPWDGCEEVAVPEGDICQSAAVMSQAMQERLWYGHEPRDPMGSDDGMNHLGRREKRAKT